MYIIFTTAISTAKKKEFMLTQTACDEPSNKHEDGSYGGPKDSLLDRQKRHTPPERHFTCHFLFLPLDTSSDSQS